MHALQVGLYTRTFDHYSLRPAGTETMDPGTRLNATQSSVCLDHP